jgi:hypothetical protein
MQAFEHRTVGKLLRMCTTPLAPLARHLATPEIPRAGQVRPLAPLWELPRLHRPDGLAERVPQIARRRVVAIRPMLWSRKACDRGRKAA